MWYYAQNGKTFGPVPLEKLKELARAGALKPTDHILPVGSQEWRAASTQADLFVRQAPPPGPGAAIPGMPGAGIRPALPADPPPLRSAIPPVMPDDAYSQGPKTWSLASHPFGDNPAAFDHPEMPSFGRRIGRHFARLFTWNLQKVAVDEDERRFLDTQGIDDPTLQRYLTWRHSLLLILVFPVFLLAMLNTIDTLTSGVGTFNALGKSILVLLILFPFALPFSALLALIVWYRPKLSWRLLFMGWVIGTVGPLLMNVIPLSSAIDFESMLPEGGRAPTDEERRVFLIAMRIIFGIGIFTLLMVQLPIFGITAVYGTQRACLRLKTLLPQSSIPGLFLAVTSVIYMFLILPFFVTASQLSPSPILLIGMILLMCSPLVYALSFKRMVSPLLEPRDFTRLKLLQITATSIFWLGALFVLVYAFTSRVPFINPELLKSFQPNAAPVPMAKEKIEPIVERTILGFSSESSWLRPWSWKLFRWLLVEVMGRAFFTMILVADLFMRVNSYIWLSGRKVMSSDLGKDYDNLMERLHSSGRWDVDDNPSMTGNSGL